jgi:hypothetical protein
MMICLVEKTQGENHIYVWTLHCEAILSWRTYILDWHQCDNDDPVAPRDDQHRTSLVVGVKTVHF